METLPGVYAELLLLNLKYQHLREICRCLLEKWPGHTTTGKLTASVVQKKCEAHEDDKTQPSSNPDESIQDRSATFQEDVNNLDELNQLDDILKRAQKIRLTQGETNECRTKSSKSSKLSTRSTKLASQVYSAEPQKTKSVSKTAVSSKHQQNVRTKSSIHSVKSSSKRGVQRTSGMKSSKHTLVVRKEQPMSRDLEDKSNCLKMKDPVPTINSNSQRHTEGTFGCDDQRSRNSGMPQPRPQETVEQPVTAFDIQQHGSRLTMPSKYYHLHRTLSKVNEDLKQEPKYGHQSQSTGDNFMKRLTGKPKESADLIRLQLTRDEYDYIKEMILSITPQEWTVSERSTWQEVLDIKLKLDSISERVQTLQNPQECALTTNKAGKETVVEDRLFTCEMPFTYSSLEEWQSVTACGHQRHLLAAEKQFLEFLKERFIPFVDLTRERGSISTLTPMLRAAYELAGAQSKPMFIRTDDS